MTDVPFWLAALLAGFFGSTHCVGMCGGIAGVLTHAVRNPPSSPIAILQCGFHLGRIFSYCVLALLFGGVLQGIAGVVDVLWWADMLRALAAVMLILMGLYLTRWWTGLTALERWGGHAWQFLQPRFLKRSSAPQQNVVTALIGGMFWGLLPCGLVYSALMTASLQGSAIQSGLFMLLFGLGTVPALLASALLTKTAASASLQRWRLIGGIVLIVFGAWVLLQLSPALLPSDSSLRQHEHHQHPPMT